MQELELQTAELLPRRETLGCGLPVRLLLPGDRGPASAVVIR